MTQPRYALYFIDPSTKEYVFSASSWNGLEMQTEANNINRNMPHMKAIVLKSNRPNHVIDPYHEHYFKPEKAFA
jgi:hypothetical protein